MGLAKTLSKGVLAAATGGLSLVYDKIKDETTNHFHVGTPTLINHSAPLSTKVNDPNTVKVDPAAFANKNAQTTRSQALAQVNAPGTVAPQAVAGHVAQVGGVAPAQLNTAYMVPGLAATGASLAAQAAARTQQQANATGRLTAAADGTVPSAAAGQLQLGLDQGLRQNLALAASHRGSAGGDILATRDALDANQGLAAQTNAQAGILRANEQAVARGQLTDALNAGRTADIQSGTLGLGLTNAGVTAAIGQGTLENQANIATAGNATQIAQTQAQLDNTTAIANVDAQLKAQGMDDTKRLAYFTQMLGIDQNTQQGQMQLAQLMAQLQMSAIGANAGIAAGNVANNQALITGVINGGAALGSAGISAGAAKGLGGGGGPGIGGSGGGSLYGGSSGPNGAIRTPDF